MSVSERRLRDVLETVQLIAISLDLDGRITFANQYFADLTGWTREELIGQRWLDRFPSGDPEFVERVKADAILVHDEQPLVTKAGDTREILWSNTLTRDVDGAIRGATSIGEDVTERNRSARQEEALRRLATMVAVEAPAGEIFHTVTEDVAQLLDAQTSNLVRFDGPSTGTVVAAWAQPDVTSLPVGEQVTFDGPTAVPIVRRTGEAARVDDYSHIDGELAERLRDLGLRSTVSAPVTVDGRVWGAITVSTIGEQTLAPDAETRIVQFTELVAVALSTAEARSQLAASRARIVAAGDAERRRLERNLHDGAQQRLVSLALGLRMARSAVGEDSDAAAMLDSASQELSEALAELRELARGIHPAVLTDRGLESAVSALTNRSTVPVKVVLDLPGELPGPGRGRGVLRDRRGAHQRRQVCAGDRGRGHHRRGGRRDPSRGLRRRWRRCRSRGGQRPPGPHRPRRGARRDAAGREPGGQGNTGHRAASTPGDIWPGRSAEPQRHDLIDTYVTSWETRASLPGGQDEALLCHGDCGRGDRGDGLLGVCAGVWAPRPAARVCTAQPSVRQLVPGVGGGLVQLGGGDALCSEPVCRPR